MEDGKTNEGDTEGKEVDTPEEEPKKDVSELGKLRAHNDEIEKELVRGREFVAEAKKIEAEKLMGGTTGEHVDSKPVDPDQEMADKLLAEDEEVA